MYKCEKCNKTSHSGDKINRVVTKTRKKEYINTFKDRRGNEKEKVSYGWEIKKQTNVCNECYKKMNENGKVEK